MCAISELCPKNSEACPPIGGESSGTMWLRMTPKDGKKYNERSLVSYISFLFLYNNSSQNVVA